uniref:Uncharacterized protein n=1 Tax=Phytophthora ramorum TaxID=164328 RepID=H3GI02_PHYRM
MADLQSKMDGHQQEIDHAKEQIHDTAQKADSYLTELTKSVEEYEKKHSDFESSGRYLKSALEASRSATQKLKTQGQDLSERTVPVAIDGMQKVRESLDELKSQAVAYDNKYAGSRGQQTVDTLQHWVNVGRQRATEALEMTNEQLLKLRDAIGNMAGQAAQGAQVAVGETVRAAELGDEKLGVSTQAGGVVQRVKDLDARLGVTATAAKVDTKEKADMAKDKACEMKGKAAEKADQAKDKTQEKAGESKGVAGQAAQKAGEVKDKAKEQLGSAADTAKAKATKYGKQSRSSK